MISSITRALGLNSLFLVLLIGSTGSLAQETPYYRYINERGVKVISTQIPSRYVKKGYDIITVDGRLIERVAPEPSEKEKAQFIKEQEERARLKKWDEDLLRRYSSTSDIEAAKQRKLAENATSIGILQRNVEKIDSEIDRYQGLAAADERQGRDVSVDTLEAIARLKRERAIELEEIAQKEKQRETIALGYDKDIERFNTIRPEAGFKR